MEMPEEGKKSIKNISNLFQSAEVWKEKHEQLNSRMETAKRRQYGLCKGTVVKLPVPSLHPNLGSLISFVHNDIYHMIVSNLFSWDETCLRVPVI